MKNKEIKQQQTTEASNDFYTLLCAGLCLKCKHKGYESDENFQKTGRCMKLFWMDKRARLSSNDIITECKLFEPCT